MQVNQRRVSREQPTRKGRGRVRRRRQTKNDSVAKPEPDNVLEIERRMQMLRWRKAQNEAKIRSKLVQTRQLKEQDQLAALVTDKAKLKAQWMQRIVEDEISKPLRVTDDFIDGLIEVSESLKTWVREQVTTDTLQFFLLSFSIPSSKKHSWNNSLPCARILNVYINNRALNLTNCASYHICL